MKSTLLTKFKGPFFALIALLLFSTTNAQMKLINLRSKASANRTIHSAAPNPLSLSGCYDTRTMQYTPMSINAIDPNAVYSAIDLAGYSGYAFKNGLATSNPGSTSMVADDIWFDGVPPYQIDKIRFTMFNFNASARSVKPRIRLYRPDWGNGGIPGELITGFDFNAISIAASGGSIITGTVPEFIMYDDVIWAALYFDNGTGTNTTTLTQLNNFGQGIWNYADVGSSDDIFWQSTDPGPFNTDYPNGDFWDFGGAPPANFGWEFVQDNPIPVTIEYLRGARNGNKHNITWKVHNTSTSRVFMSLERSGDNRNFSSIYSLSATSSDLSQAFNYSDNQPLSGINYYRLKITDLDSKVTYSPIIAILNKATGFEIINVTPNPISTGERAVLNVTSAQNQKVDIAIYDVLGKKVITQSYTVIAGSNQIELNVGKLAKGSYHVIGYTSDGNSKGASFIKQ